MIQQLIDSRFAWGLALLSGLLLFAAFPSLGWWPMGWVALAPLMVLMDPLAPSALLDLVPSMV